MLYTITHIVDAAFTGFSALPDDHKKPIAEILASRHKYFIEGSSIWSKFLDDYIGSRRSFYYDKEENRETFRHGVYFLIGTVFLDVLVMSL